MEWIQGLVQQVPEGDDHQDCGERAISHRTEPPEQDEGSAGEFYERNGEADRPE